MGMKSIIQIDNTEVVLGKSLVDSPSEGVVTSFLKFSSKAQENGWWGSPKRASTYGSAFRTIHVSDSLGTMGK